MKTTKKNIDNELKELEASFLLSVEKNKTTLPLGMENKILQQIAEQKPAIKSRPIYKMIWSASAIAACLVIGFYILNQKPIVEETTLLAENTSLLNEISKEEALVYFEDHLAYEDNHSTENFFDNTGISNEYLEEYFINQLNEEIQLEDLL